MPNYISTDTASTVALRATRILVVGCSGGGKSTLSRKISDMLDLEYISIDRDVRWLAGWVERDKSAQRTILADLVQRDRWVIDGTGTSTFDIRAPRAELVIWIRVPRRVALAGLAARVARYFGVTRPDMADGCLEKLPDKEFLSYIWNFEKHTMPKLVHNLELHGPNVPVAILESRTEIHEFVANVNPPDSSPPRTPALTNC